jgi:integrase
VKRKRLPRSTATARVNKAKGWIEHDVIAVWPNGERERERQMCPRQTLGAARDYARQRLQALLDLGPPSTRKTIERTTWAKFWPEFKRLHFVHGPRGELKPSQKASIESHWKHHIEPFWGKLAFDETTAVVIATWIAKLQEPTKIRKKERARSANTVNKIAITFNTMLNRAEEWHFAPRDLPRAPTFRIAKPEIEFYTRDDFEVLAAAAKRCGPDVEMAIQLGARAGLRAGEIVGLRASDVPADRDELLIQRSIWRGKVHAPKSGKPRRVPVSRELAAAIRERPSGYVLNDDGAPLTGRQLAHLVKRAELGAGIAGASGKVHKLRHTYASHLVMLGVPLKVVQELLGHADIATTMRYAHLAPGAMEAAVARLTGDRVETISGRAISAGKSGVSDGA